MSRPIAAVAMLALASTLVAASPDSATTPMPPDVDPRIEEIVAPLAHAPDLLTVDEDLVIEVDPARLSAAELAGATLTLSRSFGEIVTKISLGQPLEVDGDATSALWPDRPVHQAVYDLPDDVPADLYDLVLTWGIAELGLEQDTQRRAVSVVTEHKSVPRVVVIADPSVGDPRPIQDGQEPLQEDGDPTVAIDKLVRTLGNPLEGESRWAPLVKAIEEINLIRPDFVLIAGDLTFAAHPRLMPYEYEDAYRILDALEVPSFANPGNHDLYSFDYDEIEMGNGLPDQGAEPAPTPNTTDGSAMWESFFGPLHYSVDVSPDLHMVSINTFDYLDKFVFPPADEFDTLAGGNVSDAQLEWLIDDLATWRAEHPDGNLVTLAHHDPSWLSNRHAWFGQGRMELREIFLEADVGVHFAGHTHEDRVARYHEGNIAQTNGRSYRGHPWGELSYIAGDQYNAETQPSQAELGDILHDPSHGPLYVTTTSTASGLRGSDYGEGGYWGYRVADLAADEHGGYDPVNFGYQATREFLDEVAERPERWTPDHNEFGVFSYPIDRLSVTYLAMQSRIVATSDLEVGVDVYARLVLDGVGEVHGVNSEVVSIRTDGERTEVLLRANAIPHAQTLFGASLH